ncbi:MAG: cysteine hydrolase, partial [Chloroflexi bacterium]|nr:cysteine hydrolase [Chloroflexota bacterium]
EAWLERCERTGQRGAERSALAETWGAEWYGVEPREGEYVLNKFRYDSFLGTSLEFLLRARGIRTVICTGTATNVCVESTARAAHMRDFYLVVAGDCCATTDQELHRATLRNIERHFGLVANGADLERCWAQVAATAS